MPLGHCKVCQRLVAIVAGGPMPGRDKQRYWWSTEHEAPNGGPCIGARRSLTNAL